MRVVLIALLVIGLLIIAGFAAVQLGPMLTPPEPTALIEGITDVVPPVALNDVTLTDDTGATVQLSNFYGQPSLLFFGYTHCPDFCPTTLENYKRIRTELGEQGDALNYLFVSVDGTRDTPEVISRYLEGRGVSEFVTGLTEDEEVIQTMGTQYGLFFEHAPLSGEEYLVDHTTLIYLIDAEGKLRAIYNYGTATASPAVIATHLRLFLG
jgi:protein SCO1